MACFRRFSQGLSFTASFSKHLLTWASSKLSLEVNLKMKPGPSCISKIQNTGLKDFLKVDHWLSGKWEILLLWESMCKWFATTISIRKLGKKCNRLLLLTRTTCWFTKCWKNGGLKLSRKSLKWPVNWNKLMTRRTINTLKFWRKFRKPSFLMATLTILRIWFLKLIILK